MTSEPAEASLRRPASPPSSGELTPADPASEPAAAPASAGKSAASSLAELARLSSFVVLNVGAFLLIIHHLPKEEMGWYALVNVVINLAFVVADLQMEKVAVRQISQGDDPEAVVGAAVGVRLAGSVLATLATQAVFLAIGLARGEVRGDVQLGALLASSQFFGESLFVVGSVFQAQLRAYFDVAPRLLYLVLRFGLTLVLLRLDVAWWALFLAWVAAYAVGDAAALVLLRVKAGIRLRLRLRSTGPLVREASTLGIAGLLGMASVQFGTVYLGITAPAETIAVFNAAILPVQYLSMFGGVIAIVSFPLVSAAWARRDLERFARIDALARTGILTLFLPIAVVLFQLPLDSTMEKVFGDGYGAAARPLQLMSVALILVSVMIWAGFVFLAVGKPRLIISVNLMCLTIGVAASPLVVPRYGLPGLAAVGVGSTGLAAVLAIWLVQRATPGSLDVRSTIRVLGAAAALWGVMELAGTFTDNVLLLGATSLVAYPLLVGAFRVVPRSDLAAFRPDIGPDPDTPPVPARSSDEAAPTKESIRGAD